MAIEIERRYLIVNDSWKGQEGTLYKQAYLYLKDHEGVLRVRIAGEKAFITIKIQGTGFSNLEYEYEVPVEDVEDIMSRLCKYPPVEKIRYRIEHAGMIWEVDEFKGENEGLVIAEIELENEKQDFHLPNWVGKEITYDKRYLNAYLYKYPYGTWSAEER